MNIGLEALEHQLSLAVGLAAEDEERRQQSSQLGGLGPGVVDPPHRTGWDCSTRHPLRAFERGRLESAIFAEAVFEEIEAVPGGDLGRQGPSDADQGNDRGAILIGLGFQRHRPARGLHRRIVVGMAELRHGRPCLCRFIGEGKEFTDPGQVRKHFRALPCQFLQAPERRQRLAEPPLAGRLEAVVKLEAPRRILRATLEGNAGPQR